MGEPSPAVGSAGARRPSVVVLGGTGFVGRSVCGALSQAGYAVTAVGRKAAVPPAGCELLRLDLVRSGTEELHEALAALEPAAIVNAAGTVWAVGNRQPSDSELSDGNLALVQRLVEAVAGLAGRPRLVHFGSTYEYGPQPAGTVITEQTREQPVSHYGLTKLAATHLVRDSVAAGRIDAVTLRLTTSVGPWPPLASLFGKVAYGLATQPERLQVPALEDQRDLVDVRDVADAVVAAVRAPQAPPMFNIASGTVVAVAEAVDLLIRIADQPAVISWQPRETGRKDAAQVGAQHIDISAAREHLGWKPRRDLTEALTALWSTVLADYGTARTGRV